MPPVDLESLRHTLSAVLESVDDIVGSYIFRATMAVCNNGTEANAMVAERELGEKNREILAQHGAKVLADMGMNDRNAPGLICGVILAGYTINNVRVIRQLKEIARAQGPRREARP
jgi:hypothetical protein